MTTRKGCGLLVFISLLATALLSGCGSSATTPIPTFATIFYSHSVVFKNSSTNTLYTSGYNGFGQLGNGDPRLNTQTIFAPVPGLVPVNLAAAGADHTLAAFKNQTTMYAWGGNYNGELGVPTIPVTGGGAFSSVPVKVHFAGPDPNAILTPNAYLVPNVNLAPYNHVQAIAAGGNHSLAIIGASGATSGQVWAWGYNGFGQVGDGKTTADHTAPAQVQDQNGVAIYATQIAGGGSHSLALTTAGNVYAWGYNAQGQLGMDPLSPPFRPQGSFSPAATPVPASGQPLQYITKIAAGGSNSYALEEDPGGTQTLWAWGYDGMGQLGVDYFKTTTLLGYEFVPQKIDLSTAVLGGKKVVKISAGTDHLLILLDDGTVWGIGFNGLGQLGDNTLTNRSYFVQVVTGPGGQPLGAVTDIIAFGNQSMARSAGIWYGWGDNGNGQIGSPVTIDTIGFMTVPTLVQGLN